VGAVWEDEAMSDRGALSRYATRKLSGSRVQSIASYVSWHVRWLRLMREWLRDLSEVGWLRLEDILEGLADWDSEEPQAEPEGTGEDTPDAPDAEDTSRVDGYFVPDAGGPWRIDEGNKNRYDGDYG
jgi:hypothetical protein